MSDTRSPRTDDERGIVLVNVDRNIYECREYGARWSPITDPNTGRYGRGWWHCPHGCNIERSVR